MKITRRDSIKVAAATLVVPAIVTGSPSKLPPLKREDWPYCELCGNAQVPNRDEPCPRCWVWLKGPLARAWRTYQRLRETDRRCCGGLAVGKYVSEPHLYFHVKYWDSDYTGVVSVECGVNLYADRAETCYVLDMDSSTFSEEYRDRIPLPDLSDKSWDEFYTRLSNQLDEAAESAYNADWINCSGCGYHMYAAGDDHADCRQDEEEE